MHDAECVTLPDGMIRLVGGQVLGNVHSPGQCGGARCCIHFPSDHHMRTWMMHYRDDRGIMERICDHGIGHPDPDSPWPANSDEWSHGCDGCCSPPKPVTKQELKECLAELQGNLEEFAN